MKKILLTPFNKREDADKDMLSKCLCETTFFKERKNGGSKLSSKDIEDLTHALKFKESYQHDRIFSYGSEGDIFYIIISGEVSVK